MSLALTCPTCGQSSESPFCPHDGSRMQDAQVNIVDPLLGVTIAERYLIEGHIGSGGYGDVYRARHVETGGAVALKVLRQERGESSSATKRFYREARNMHQLRHPNTVRLVDFGTSNGMLYLAMEFVEGQTLGQMLKAKRVFSVQDALHIARQILQSVGEAHALGIVHRDLKPQNILITPMFGAPNFVKVVDLGLSRAIAGDDWSSQAVVGTPHYMAPELWVAGDIDGRVDLYAVGVLLFRMLSGRLPYQAPKGASAVVLMDAHRNAPIPPLLSVAPQSVPASVARAVTSLLGKRRTERPATALDALRLLELDPTTDPLDEISSATDSNHELDVVARRAPPRANATTPAPTIPSESPPASPAVSFTQSWEPAPVTGESIVVDTKPRKGRLAVVAVVVGILLVGAIAATGFELLGPADRSSRSAPAATLPIRASGLPASIDGAPLAQPKKTAIPASAVSNDAGVSDVTSEVTSVAPIAEIPDASDSASDPGNIALSDDSSESADTVSTDSRGETANQPPTPGKSQKGERRSGKQKKRSKKPKSSGPGPGLPALRLDKAP